MDYCVVLVTVSSESEAKTIARALVEERLAACVNIIPGLTSIYRWEEKICEDRELLLVIKTQGHKMAALRERIAHLHSYACLLYTSPSPRDRQKSRMPSSA